MEFKPDAYYEMYPYLLLLLLPSFCEYVLLVWNVIQNPLWSIYISVSDHWYIATTLVLIIALGIPLYKYSCRVMANYVEVVKQRDIEERLWKQDINSAPPGTSYAAVRAENRRIQEEEQERKDAAIARNRAPGHSRALIPNPLPHQAEGQRATQASRPLLDTKSQTVRHEAYTPAPAPATISRPAQHNMYIPRYTQPRRAEPSRASRTKPSFQDEWKNDPRRLPTHDTSSRQPEYLRNGIMGEMTIAGARYTAVGPPAQHPQQTALGEPMLASLQRHLLNPTPVCFEIPVQAPAPFNLPMASTAPAFMPPIMVTAAPAPAPIPAPSVFAAPAPAPTPAPSVFAAPAAAAQPATQSADVPIYKGKLAEYKTKLMAEQEALKAKADALKDMANSGEQSTLPVNTPGPCTISSQEALDEAELIKGLENLADDHYSLEKNRPQLTFHEGTSSPTTFTFGSAGGSASVGAPSAFTPPQSQPARGNVVDTQLADARKAVQSFGQNVKKPVNIIQEQQSLSQALGQSTDPTPEQTAQQDLDSLLERNRFWSDSYTRVRLLVKRMAYPELLGSETPSRRLETAKFNAAVSPKTEEGYLNLRLLQTVLPKMDQAWLDLPKSKFTDSHMISFTTEDVRTYGLVGLLEGSMPCSLHGIIKRLSTVVFDEALDYDRLIGCNQVQISLYNAVVPLMHQTAKVMTEHVKRLNKAVAASQPPVLVPRTRQASRATSSSASSKGKEVEMTDGPTTSPAQPAPAQSAPAQPAPTQPAGGKGKEVEMTDGPTTSSTRPASGLGGNASGSRQASGRAMGLPNFQKSKAPGSFGVKSDISKARPSPGLIIATHQTLTNPAASQQSTQSRPSTGKAKSPAQSLPGLGTVESHVPRPSIPRLSIPQPSIPQPSIPQPSGNPQLLYNPHRPSKSLSSTGPAQAKENAEERKLAADILQELQDWQVAAARPERRLNYLATLDFNVDPYTDLRKLQAVLDTWNEQWISNTNLDELTRPVIINFTQQAAQVYGFSKPQHELSTIKLLTELDALFSGRLRQTLVTNAPQKTKNLYHKLNGDIRERIEQMHSRGESDGRISSHTPINNVKTSSAQDHDMGDLPPLPPSAQPLTPQQNGMSTNDLPTNNTTSSTGNDLTTDTQQQPSQQQASAASKTTNTNTTTSLYEPPPAGRLKQIRDWLHDSKIALGSNPQPRIELLHRFTHSKLDQDQLNRGAARNEHDIRLVIAGSFSPAHATGRNRLRMFEEMLAQFDAQWIANEGKRLRQQCRVTYTPGELIFFRLQPAVGGWTASVLELLQAIRDRNFADEIVNLALHEVPDTEEKRKQDAVWLKVRDDVRRKTDEMERLLGTLNSTMEQDEEL